MLPTTSKAEDSDFSFKYGVGIAESADKSYSETKAGFFTYQKPLLWILTQQYETGFWTDTRTDMGRHFSGIVDYGLGVTVGERAGLYAQSIWGAGVITHTDAFLGGHFQFTQDLSLGLRDDMGRSIGLDYKHISSAGLESPNKGRDFMLIRVTVPLF